MRQRVVVFFVVFEDREERETETKGIHLELILHSFISRSNIFRAVIKENTALSILTTKVKKS